MAAVQAIFDRYADTSRNPSSTSPASPPPPEINHQQLADLPGRYLLIKAKTGPAYDNATMDNTTLLDASVGPPYDVAALGDEGLPAPPNTGIVSSCTSRLFIGPYVLSAHLASRNSSS